MDIPLIGNHTGKSRLFLHYFAILVTAIITKEWDAGSRWVLYPTVLVALAIMFMLEILLTKPQYSDNDKVNFIKITKLFEESNLLRFLKEHMFINSYPDYYVDELTEVTRLEDDTFFFDNSALQKRWKLLKASLDSLHEDIGLWHCPAENGVCCFHRNWRDKEIYDEEFRKSPKSPTSISAVMDDKATRCRLLYLEFRKHFRSNDAK